MKEIEITIEKVQIVAKTYTVTDSVYEEIKRTNRIPDDMFEEMQHFVINSTSDCEYDYAVWSETESRQLIEWG